MVCHCLALVLSLFVNSPTIELISNDLFSEPESLSNSFWILGRTAVILLTADINTLSPLPKVIQDNRVSRIDLSTELPIVAVNSA